MIFWYDRGVPPLFDGSKEGLHPTNPSRVGVAPKTTRIGPSPNPSRFGAAPQKDRDGNPQPFVIWNGLPKTQGKTTGTEICNIGVGDNRRQDRVTESPLLFPFPKTESDQDSTAQKTHCLFRHPLETKSDQDSLTESQYAVRSVFLQFVRTTASITHRKATILFRHPPETDSQNAHVHCWFSPLGAYSRAISDFVLAALKVTAPVGDAEVPAGMPRRS